MSGFTYRTFNPAPSDYERTLADRLFEIMSARTYDAAAIAAELNRAGPPPAGGKTWTVAGLKAEMRRLGDWSNCVGGPVGSHSLPGHSVRTPV